MQLHEIKPFLQLSIHSSSWHFSAEQHRNNSTAQSSSLITPINHGNDKTKPRRTSHGNIFRKGQHLQLPWRKKNNPCGLLGSADTFPEYSQSIPTAVGPPGSCLTLLPRPDRSRCLVFISAETATPSTCAASAVLGREVKTEESRDSAHFYPAMGWERLKAIGRFVFGGVTHFLSLQAH